MRNRIILAFTAILAVALVLAGGVSLLLVRNAARENAERTVLRQVKALVKSAQDISGSSPASSQTSYQALLPLVRSIAGLQTPNVLVVGPNGELCPKPSATCTFSPPLPGIPAGALDTALLARGVAVSGSDDAHAFAAAPLLSVPASATSRASTIALVLESTVSFSSDSVSYFLVAGGISLVVAAGLAAAISQRISRRLVAAAGAATRIAGGDLAARVSLDRRDYPELAALGTSINAMAAGLEHARHLERQFLLSVSHDLRTPLTSIRGYAEAIADGAAPDPGRAAAVVVSEAQRLERLIGDLLDLARLDAHRFSLDLAPTDLADSVAAAAQALRYEFESAGVALEVVVPERAPALADDDRVRQIVANLLENALKFAHAEVGVALVPAGRDLLFTVTDDGPGVAPDDLPHIFERLYTSQRQPARAAGTGLGLAIVAELTEAMGGTVAVTSPLRDHGGTEIAVRLPAQHTGPVDVA